MGLDMFLYKVKREEVGYWRKANAIHGWFERKYGDGEPLENCKDYYVKKEDLIELRDLCKHVLERLKVTAGKVQNGSKYNPTIGEWEGTYEDGEVISNPELAKELLPTQDGFFFGSTNYDQFYISDLESTVEQIDNILENTDFEQEDVVYMAWW